MTPDPRDPLGLRADAPLLDAWLRFTERAGAGTLRPFTIPGHKQRTDLVGDVIRGDVPLYAGLDTMKLSDGLLVEAEARAAALWQVDWCRFSTGGATHGNQALALAVGSPGREVVVSRTLHRSMLLGLVLAGLRPVWVSPTLDSGTGLPGGVDPAVVRAALAAHPSACAVMVGDPSYVGGCGDVAALATVAHDAGVPLLVDAAWAAHFGFHPDLPRHALADGADAVVTSAHKTLPAWSAAAIVLARSSRAGGLLDPDRLDRAFDATRTTSDSGAALASIDAVRALLAAHGPRLLGRTIDLVAAARDRLRAVRGVQVVGTDAAGVVDPTKLVVLLAETGAHGHAVEADLLAEGYPVEMADRDTLIAMVTVADDATTLTPFLDALVAAIERHRGPARHLVANAAWSVDPIVAMSPRDAFFARHETVGRDLAVGRISAELVCPYPPGVPVLAPGEVVTAAALAALSSARADGGRIAYAADPSMETLQVVAAD